MDKWVVLSRTADIIGILIGVASLVISIFTLRTTKGIKSGIRKSKLISAESSDYAQAIDEQVNELEAYRSILLGGKSIPDTFFSELTSKLGDINIAYETILPPNLYKAINGLISFIVNHFLREGAKHDNQTTTKCVSKLGYIITELKKEKNIL